MTNAKSAKRALLASVMALLLCFTMLLGTTFAWFTDSAVSGSNVITAGNLDIEVQYTLDGENWNTLDGATNLFQKGLWEPGHTEVVALKIENKGSLALKYTANMNIIDETVGKTADGKDIVLSDILTVSTLVQQSGQIGDIALMLAFNGENSVAYEQTAAFKASNVLRGDVELAPNNVHYLIVKVDMAESVANEANHNGTDVPAISFGINVLATQFAYENDSLGKDYDKDAAYPEIALPKPTVRVESAEELLTALSNMTKPTMIDATGVTIVADDTLTVPAGVTLKGVTVVPAGSTAKVVIDGVGEDVVFENCTFKANNFSQIIIAGATENGANAVFENCDFSGMIMPNFTANAAGTATFNTCRFTVISGEPGYVNCMGGTHTFTNCTFDFTGGATFGSNQYVKWNAVNSYSERYSTAVVLEGCQFINCGTQRYGSNSTLTVK